MEYENQFLDFKPKALNQILALHITWSIKA